MNKSLLMAAALLSAPTVAKDKAPPPVEPASHPGWREPTKRAEAQLLGQLFDPEAGRIRWVSGYRWTTWREDKGGLWSGGMLNMRRRYGWMACGTLNGKNRMGGYVGEQAVYTITEKLA